jgi:cytochrome b6-f complex iron-sulfur subunit
MQRREFVVLGVSAFSLAGCAGVRYVEPRATAGRLTIARADLEEAGQVFVQTAEMQRPIYVRRLESGQVVAVLASCTHQGCQPEPVVDRLACPCHGSEFSFEGLVLQGPAERPLTRYEITEEGDEVIVWLEGRGA